MKLNFQKLDIEIPVEIPVNFMISTGTGIPANRLILTGTGILPGSRSILECNHSSTPNEIILQTLSYSRTDNRRMVCRNDVIKSYFIYTIFV